MPTYTLTIDQTIAHLRLSRPNASNALNADFWNGIAADVAALDRTGAVRVMVISAEGNTFCAGMDLAEFANGIPDPATPAAREGFYHLAVSLQEAFTCLERARFPVFAAIQGPCLGAGLELVAACDLRFTSSDAYFRIEEINTGIMADVGALQRLPKILPEPVVKEMAFLGAPLSAERAAAFGFTAGVHDDAQAALNAAMKAAQTVCEKAPVAVAGTKAAIAWARDHSVSDALEWSARTQSALWSTKDIITAIAARKTRSPVAFEALVAKKPIGDA